MNVHLEKFTPPEGATVSICVEITAKANITPFVAQQKVNYFVIMNVSTQCMSGDPELIVGERLIWLVPVLLTSPRRGIVGKIGELKVDATTGEVLTEEDTAKRLIEDAERLAIRSPL
jgi:hypothetical protein